MYALVLQIHSILRWAVLVFGILAIIRGIQGSRNNTEFTDSDRKSGLFFLISAHTQLLIGLVLYLFLSPVTQQAFQNFGAAMKDSSLRYFAVEHIFVNILAVILITIAYSKNKKSTDSQERHKRAWKLYALALILIVSRIPWDRLF